MNENSMAGNRERLPVIIVFRSMILSESKEIKMYLISQVSKITGLTKKALRYYDEQDILKRSFRDEENQYRFYDENDLKKAQLINLLRTMTFPCRETLIFISE